MTKRGDCIWDTEGKRWYAIAEAEFTALNFDDPRETRRVMVEDIAARQEARRIGDLIEDSIKNELHAKPEADTPQSLSRRVSGIERSLSEALYTLAELKRAFERLEGELHNRPPAV
jgi:hypothetical protein